MSVFDDYTPEVPATHLEDREVEQLLSRSSEIPEDLADLETFISAMSEGAEAPRDVGHMATSLAATARASGRPRRAGIRRLATLTASMAILLAFSGVAMAANGASPGDALYPVDLALERIGIGAGGVDERIEEFDDLLGSDGGEAYAFLAEYIGSADDEDANIASEHLVSTATDSSSNADDAQEKVAAILAFIEESKADGLDGRDLGQGVAAIARGETEIPGESNTGTEPGSNGRGQGQGGPAENPGPPDGTPATPNNDDSDPPGQQRNSGQPDDPGPPDQRGSSGENPPSDQKGSPDETGPPDDTGPGGDTQQEGTPGTSPGDTAPGATNPGNGNSGNGNPGNGNSGNGNSDNGNQGNGNGGP